MATVFFALGDHSDHGAPDDVLESNQWNMKWPKIPEGLLERIRIKARFNHDDFDFFFQWLMGTQINGGVETGEALY